MVSTDRQRSNLDELSALLSEPEAVSALPLATQARISEILGRMRSGEGVEQQQHHADVMRLFSGAQACLAGAGEDATLYSVLLKVAVSFMSHVELALMAVVENDQWRVAATHGFSTRVYLHAISPYADRDYEITRIEHPEDWRTLPLAPDARETLQEAIPPVSSLLVGAFSVTAETRLVCFVDTARGSEHPRSTEVEQDFTTFLKMGSYLHQYLSSRIDAQKKSIILRKSFQEIEVLSGKLKQMLTLTSKLGDEYSDLDSFFEELLKTALMVVEVADYGSVSLIENGTWRFITAIGHDADALRRIKFDADYVLEAPDVRVVDDILAEDQQVMPDEALAALQAASKPISSSLVVNLPVADTVKINLTLDIAADSNDRFPDSIDRVFKAFANLASGFLKLRLHAKTMRNSYVRFANKLATVAEAHDRMTGLHNKRVAYLSGLLAHKYGAPASMVEDLYHFASLHDIGKIFMDREIINTSGALTEEEFEIMKQHTVLGEKLLDDPLFVVARNIAMYHHERYDGSGYPYGLSGDQIPLEAQIVALADVYDALRSDRSYKSAQPPEEVLHTLMYGDARTKPEHFNPALVALLKDNMSEIEAKVYAREIRDEDLWGV